MGCFEQGSLKFLGLELPDEGFVCPGVPVWKDKCLPKKDRTSLRMETVNPLPLNYYNFEIKGHSGKDRGVGIIVLY